MSFKSAFISSHGVGKTTLAYGLAARLKSRDLSLEVLVEVARRCPLPLNEDTNVAAQSWILHSQVAEEVLAAAKYPVVLCDRSVLDNYVYLLLADGPQQPLEAFLESWLQTYDLLVHVPIVEGEVLEDGIRSTSRSFQRAVDDRLREELDRRAVARLELDAEKRSSWLDTVEAAILEKLEPPQLRLL